MRRILLAAAAASILLSGKAVAQTTMSLNTGYNYQTFSLYPTPAITSITPDRYWIKIASYEPPAPSVPVAPAWVIRRPTAWAPPLTFPAGNPSHWDGPRQTAASAPGASQANPGWSLFRKCFCLLRGYQNPRLQFQARSDNTIEVYLNTPLNQLLGPVPGNFNGPPRAGSTANPAHFRLGLNCLYVLVFDDGTVTGFNLAGTVTAMGLLPMAGAWAGAGNSPNFEPCRCTEGQGADDTHRGTTAAAHAAAPEAFDDSEVVRAIARSADERVRRPARPAEQ